MRVPETTFPVFVSVDRDYKQPGLFHFSFRKVHAETARSVIAHLGMIHFYKYGEQAWQCYTLEYKDQQLKCFNKEAGQC